MLFSFKLHLKIAEIELGMLKCHYSGLIVVWWHSATGLEGKNGTLLTTLLYSWQQTKSPSLLLQLTMKCSMEGLRSQVYPWGFAEWLKSCFVPASTCHRHGQFSHVKPCKMRNSSNVSWKYCRHPPSMSVWGCPDVLLKPQRSENSECPTLGFVPCGLPVMQPSIFA